MDTKAVIHFKSDYLKALQVSVNSASSVESAICNDGFYDISVNDLVTRNVDQTLRFDVEERCRVWQKLDDEHLISARSKGGCPERWATKGHLAIPHGFSLTVAQPLSALSHRRIPEAIKEEYLLQLQSLLHATPTAQIIGKKLDNTKQLHLKRLKCGIDRDDLGQVDTSLDAKYLMSLADDLKAIERAPCSISSTSISAEHVIQKRRAEQGSSRSSQEKVAATEVILSFSFYGKSGFAGAKLQRLQDFDLLGCQTLRQLRSCLRCGDKGKDDSSDKGFFFIEDTFYADETSEEGVDSSDVALRSNSLHSGIKKWWAKQRHSKAVTEIDTSYVHTGDTQSPAIPLKQREYVEADCEGSNVAALPSTSTNTNEITSTRGMCSRTSKSYTTNASTSTRSDRRSVSLRDSDSPAPTCVPSSGAGVSLSLSSGSSSTIEHDRISVSTSRKRSRPMSSRGGNPSRSNADESSALSDGAERELTCTSVDSDGQSGVQTQQSTLQSTSLNVQSQDIALHSLNLRVGVRYLFRHGSSDSYECEHHFYVTDMHLLCPHDIGPSSANRLSLSRDMPQLCSYPRQTFAARTLAKKCNVCVLWGARYAVYGDRLADRSPMLMCQHCYYIMHYSPSGDLIYDDFLVVPYVNDVPDEQ